MEMVHSGPVQPKVFSPTVIIRDGKGCLGPCKPSPWTLAVSSTAGNGVGELAESWRDYCFGGLASASCSSFPQTPALCSGVACHHDETPAGKTDHVSDMLTSADGKSFEPRKSSPRTTTLSSTSACHGWEMNAGKTGYHSRGLTSADDRISGSCKCFPSTLSTLPATTGYHARELASSKDIYHADGSVSDDDNTCGPIDLSRQKQVPTEGDFGCGAEGDSGRDAGMCSRSPAIPFENSRSENFSSYSRPFTQAISQVHRRPEECEQNMHHQASPLYVPLRHPAPEFLRPEEKCPANAEPSAGLPAPAGCQHVGAPTFSVPDQPHPSGMCCALILPSSGPLVSDARVCCEKRASLNAHEHFSRVGPQLPASPQRRQGNHPPDQSGYRCTEPEYGQTYCRTQLSGYTITDIQFRPTADPCVSCSTEGTLCSERCPASNGTLCRLPECCSAGEQPCTSAASPRSDETCLRLHAVGRERYSPEEIYRQSFSEEDTRSVDVDHTPPSAVSYHGIWTVVRTKGPPYPVPQEVSTKDNPSSEIDSLKPCNAANASHTSCSCQPLTTENTNKQPHGMNTSLRNQMPELTLAASIPYQEKPYDLTRKHRQISDDGHNHCYPYENSNFTETHSQDWPCHKGPSFGDQSSLDFTAKRHFSQETDTLNPAEFDAATIMTEMTPARFTNREQIPVPFCKDTHAEPRQEFLHAGNRAMSTSPSQADTESGDVPKSHVRAAKRKRSRARTFPCPLCSVACSNRGQLMGHLRTHTGERPFPCPEPGCRKTFVRNEELTRHRRIHSGERPYCCGTCGKAFTRKDHLNKHVRVHDLDLGMQV